jgi:AraC family transcriptional regulator
MEPKIVTVAPLHVIGLQIRTVGMSPEIPALWPRFVARIPELRQAGQPRVTYGVMQRVAGQSDALLYTAAVATPAGTLAPDGMTASTLPGGKHVVFEFASSEIGRAYSFMFGTWLPASGFTMAPSPFFERYGEDFDPGVPGSPMQVYLPIVESGG